MVWPWLPAEPTLRLPSMPVVGISSYRLLNFDDNFEKKGAPRTGWRVQVSLHSSAPRGKSTLRALGAGRLQDPWWPARATPRTSSGWSLENRHLKHSSYQWRNISAGGQLQIVCWPPPPPPRRDPWHWTWCWIW